MECEKLKSLLNISDRERIYNSILSKLRENANNRYLKYISYKFSDGVIPVITCAESLDISKIRYVKVFVAAQHNEYSGLYGILEFFKNLKEEIINIREISNENQILIFFPLMNPYGFLNPEDSNKSGYYLKNGTNLNRFWRRLFVPKYDKKYNAYEIPKQAIFFKETLQRYWNHEEISIYIMDFHETSLIQRYLADLKKKLKKELFKYKFDHWLKEKLLLNILKLYNISNSQEPLFYKRNVATDYTQINLTVNQLNQVYNNLLTYIDDNKEKLFFYFCHSEKSKESCERLARIVYNKLRGKLWNTSFIIHDHKFQDHGCFIKMNDATKRHKVYCMELESDKLMFNILEEIEKSKNPNYLDKKVKLMNTSIELVYETIIEMIRLF